MRTSFFFFSDMWAIYILLYRTCVRAFSQCPGYSRLTLTLINTHPQTTQDQDPHHGHQAFPAAVPRLWNALPDHLKPPQTTAVFKKNLRLIFFKKPFANFPFTVYALYV